MTTPSAVLELKSVNFAYPNEQSVLVDLDLRVNEGERVGLIGPNGAGKSTLFLLSTGILSPVSGEVLLQGEPVKEGGFNPKLGLVFQDTDDQLFCPTVFEDIAFGPNNMGMTSEQVEKRVDEVLTRVGVMKLRDRDIHHLSGGEKRIVAIAGILAMEPEMIIYDEPSVGLDMRTRRRLIEIMQDASKTSLVASHDLELILETCDRVIVLDNHSIVADGDPAKILGNEELMLKHGQEKPHSLRYHEHFENRDNSSE